MTTSTITSTSSTSTNCNNTSINKDETRTTLLFDEIFPRLVGANTSSTPTFVEVYVVQVQPHDCGRLIKWLAKELPLSNASSSSLSITDSSTGNVSCDLSHLKRVRKSKIKVNSNFGACVKEDMCLDNSHDLDDVKDSFPTFTNTSIIDNNSPLNKKLKYSNENKAKTDSITVSNKLSRRNHDEKIEVILHDVGWLDNVSSNSSDDNNNMMRLTHLEVLLEKMSRYLECSSGVKNKSKNHHDSALLSPEREPISFQVVKESVPARNAKSEDEWRLFNSIWPVHYFPNKMMDHLVNTMAITQHEHEQMIIGMKAAIDDSVRVSKFSMFGAVIVDPKSGHIVSTSYDEFCIQQERFRTYQYQHDGTNPILLCKQNPLVTSIILACQGVSRIERQNAIELGMKSENFQKGQYICTGYDVYTTIEPTTFEAMALIHSRINRLVFGRRFSEVTTCVSNNENKTVHYYHRHSSGIVQSQVHDIPGMNHKYRVFQCKPQSELWSLCCQT